MTKRLMQNNRNAISAGIIAFMLVLISVVIFLTSFLTPMHVRSTVADAKTMGADWATFANGYAAPAAPPSTIGKTLVNMADLYNELGINGTDGTFNAGVITQSGSGVGAKYINGTGGNNLDGYNYCISISTAQELLMFSTLCSGRPYGQLISEVVISAISTFFRSANVILTNNINYSGNSGYSIKFSNNFSESIYLGVSGSVEPIKGTKIFGSNGVYGGYGSGDVPYPFVPITDFNGCFEGQNFDIFNLSILRNLNKYNNTGYDAFFAIIANNGVARNFGLSNTTFVLHDTLSSPYADKDNIVAGFCGINNGTIQNVYNSVSMFTGDQDTFKVVASGANATNYYCGSAGIHGIKKGDVNNKLWRGYFSENGLNGAPTEPANKDGWYWVENGDRFTNSFHDFCKSGYRLNGLKKDGTIVGEQNYIINSVADFVTFLHVFKEGFTRTDLADTAILDTIASKGKVYVKIANDLNFAMVNHIALIPAIDLGGSLGNEQASVTLYSGNNKGGTGGNGNADLTARATLSNMTLNTFIDYGYEYRSYGIFASADLKFTSSPIAVYSLNLINCNIDVANEQVLSATANKSTSAGVIAGLLKREIDIRYVSYKGDIMGGDGNNTWASNRFGGLVGSLLFTGGADTTNYIAAFSNVSVLSNIDGGRRNFYATDNGMVNKGFMIGGVIGFNDTGNINANTKKNVRYNMISVMGNLTSFAPIKNTCVGGGSATVAVGGLLGYGAITNYGATNTDLLIDSVYIGANISMPQTDANELAVFEIYLGGLSGMQSGGTAKFNNANNSKLGFSVESTFNIVSTSASAVTCSAGGFTGSFGNGTASGFKTTDVFSGKFVLDSNSTLSLNIGNLFGKLTGTAHSITNDKPITVSGAAAENSVGTLASLALGGIAGAAGNSSSVMNNNFNSASVTASVNATSVLVGGIAANVHNATGNINYGKIMATGSILNTSTTAIGGISATLDKNTLSFDKNINNGEIIYNAPIVGKFAYVGGLVGSCNDSAATRVINDCYNFGSVSFATNVSGTTAGYLSGVGGIVGAVINNANLHINNCVNAGAIGGVYPSGGIVGRSNATATVTVNSGLNYGEISAETSGGIIGSVGGTASVSGAINYGLITATSTSGGNIVGTVINSGAVTARQVYGYYANNFGGGAYAETEPPVEGFTKVPTTVPTLAYSERPFKMSDGAYHNSVITDSNKKCFAITTVNGRLKGNYVGENYDLAAIKIAFGGEETAEYKQMAALLADCKQIEYSTDTFHLQDKMQLYDSVLKQNLPESSFIASSNTFVTTILSSSPYYTNNIGKPSFSLLAGSIIITNDLQQCFSANVKFNPASLVFSGDGYDFIAGGNNPSLIATATLTVYQGDGHQGDNYETVYNFKVYFYNIDPAFRLDVVDKKSTLEQKTTIGDNSTVTNLDMTTAEINGDSTIYTPKIEGAAITSSWIYSKLSVSFIISGLDYAYVSGNKITSQLFQKTGGSYSVFTSWAHYVYAQNKFTALAPTPGDELAGIPPVANTSYTLDLYITDRLTDKSNLNINTSRYEYLKELPQGEYKFEIKLPTTTSKTFVRAFCFSKQASGDVYLHRADNRPVESDSVDVYAGITPMEDALNTGKVPTYVLPFTQKTSIFDQSFVLSGENYYGYAPTLGLIDTNFLNIYRWREVQSGTTNYLPVMLMNDAKLSSPTIKINYLPNTDTLIGFTYSFTITAQNADKANYVHTYKYDKVPVGKNEIKSDGVIATNNETVARTEGKVFTARHSFDVANTNLTTTDIMYSPDNIVARQRIGYIDALGNIVDDDTNTFNLKASQMNFTVSRSGNMLTIKFFIKTAGGYYTFAPRFKYAKSLNVPDGAIKNYTLLVNDSDTGRTLVLGEFTASTQNYTISKVASRNAYIRDTFFSGNTPTGGMLLYNNGSEFVDLKSQAISGGLMSLDYGAKYVQPGAGGYGQTFRSVYNFPNEGGEDYTSILRFKLKGVPDPSDNTKYYNDEDTNFYLMTLNNIGGKDVWVESGTAFPKTPYDAGGNVVAEGSTNIDYYMCEQFLPESTIVKVRVRAGNPAYFNDYELLSAGPLRNKNFNITIKAGGDAKDVSFVASLGLMSAKTNGVIRTNSFLYNCNNGSGKYDAAIDLENNYSKTYNSVFNTEGTYVFSLFSFSGAYKATITSIEVKVGDAAKLIFNPNSSSFSYNDNNMATLDITITITKNNSPPWGDNVFG